MKSYPFDRTLSTELELLDYYLDAVNYRNIHKNLSSEIATHVFNKTHQALHSPFPTSQEIVDLRYEFGALEAPGMPPNDWQDPDVYTDQVWQRLFNLLIEAKKKRTV